MFSYWKSVILGKEVQREEINQPPPLLDTPWRELKFTKEVRTELFEDIKKYTTKTDDVEQPRILLIGQIKAGKSSFFNSVNSVFKGYPVFQATVRETGGSMTKHCRTYRVYDSNDEKLPFTFCDIMGLEPYNDKGIIVKDIINVIKGYIPDNYKFDPTEAKEICMTCTEQPSLADKVHCIVYVIDANAVSLWNNELQNKFEEILEEAHRLGIPQLVMLTKVDLACNFVKEDLTKVYQSRYIQELAIKVSQMVGVPVSSVLPVRNYWFETDLNMKVDILILKALQTILRQAGAFFDEVKQRGNSREAPPLNCEGISCNISNS
ncbi:interferon-induced protein 44-like [Erpetoichthys calabaricus]|uniref:Interferon-induced protein 44-like n=1 Tax=Erpetoichthys calabaricus TaxID=27687 RepID=A0A8C4T2I7_ERPCA|nr:interferon-induced protein 44-like [Erpetoichthys calabaricus]